MRAIVLFLALCISLGQFCSAYAQAPQHALPPGLRCPGDKVVWSYARTWVTTE